MTAASYLPSRFDPQGAISSSLDPLTYEYPLKYPPPKSDATPHKSEASVPNVNCLGSGKGCEDIKATRGLGTPSVSEAYSVG